MSLPASETPSRAARTLAAADLRRRCDLSASGFSSTEDLADSTAMHAQPRAVEALRFGVGIRREGYNLYAMGPAGYGRHTAVKRLLEERAAAEPLPEDWCYVFNFKTPHRPCRLKLPPGQAPRFRQVMQRLVEDLHAGISAAFETDEYRARQQEIETEFNEHQSQAVSAVGEKARKEGVALLRTPAGFAFAPVRADAVMEPDEFRKLPEAERQRLEKTIAALQEELERVIQDVPKWRREAQRRLRELNRQVTSSAVNSLIEELKTDYRELPQVVEHLERVQEDVLDHIEYFRQPKEGEQPSPFALLIGRPEPGESALRRYQVNVLVEHAADGGAPVVHEDNPTHGNLVGRIEHIAQMGTLVTDFTLIKAGALHRANGGYLVLDALRVLQHPFSWDALKRALRAREIRSESPAQALSLISTVSLEPEPIPLDVKVVLVGERMLYYLLHEYDPDFRELFKVAIDFDDDTERAGESEQQHARVIATLVRAERLLPLERSGVERVIEHASRHAGDAGRLSLNLRGLADLLREADYWARVAGRTMANAADVQRAIDSYEQRRDRVRQRLQREVLRGTLLVDTAGARVGQVNGLAVLELGGYAFGMAHRITARVRMGGGKVVDIEREAELGGPIHSKGVLILSGYLAGRYAPRQPLSLAASLVFEQTYSGVEGDSASCAELCALLSALADAPLVQGLAVTGSVSQHGDVQAIGGVNEKIEGFFDLCRARGLDGRQGVLIPGANVKHLMLRDEVVEAAAAGKFRIHAVHSVDQAIEILAGVPAEEVNRRVEARLQDFAERARAAGATGAPKKAWRGRPPR